MKKNNKKDFDCLEMKWKAQAEIYEEIKNLNPKEQIEYFNKGALEGPLGQWYKEVLKKKKPKKAANE